ncbi:GNAT family N-acetyltransferase [Acidithiobacillus marinus]|uniref:GNAT family N-acetyltransferase n=1 Tax=Acidithiobacillus marinus TaxID=187490 RepID=A0A2I1DN98_9PROT|nr:GNAT family N-acetyltransferase [Acidithiobacillus marinus]PKY11355.1 GNAT family N-acetyltransferase [Acidithiobacillus marinus]
MIKVCLADYHNPQHCLVIRKLIDQYAQDDMGQGAPLRQDVYENLLENLAIRSWVHIFLAVAGKEIVGIAVCIEGFSTFNGAALLNIHDVYVVPEFRRQGIARTLFSFIEDHAREQKFCKLTLEVLEGNIPAQKSYRSFGFQPYTINEDGGVAQFWHKYLV